MQLKRSAVQNQNHNIVSDSKECAGTHQFLAKMMRSVEDTMSAWAPNMPAYEVTGAMTDETGSIIWSSNTAALSVTATSDPSMNMWPALDSVTVRGSIGTSWSVVVKPSESLTARIAVFFSSATYTWEHRLHHPPVENFQNRQQTDGGITVVASADKTKSRGRSNFATLKAPSTLSPIWGSTELLMNVLVGSCKQFIYILCVRVFCDGIEKERTGHPTPSLGSQ
jgi:hypothetical protein